VAVCELFDKVAPLAARGYRAMSKNNGLPLDPGSEEYIHAMNKHSWHLSPLRPRTTWPSEVTSVIFHEIC